jgi:hypothetical protein
MRPAAVLDANVLFPMALRDMLLRLAEEGCYRAHWSAEILEETRRNLVKQARMSAARANRLIAVMNTAFPDAMVEGYADLIEAMPCHPKDRHVAAAAVRVEAGTVVTSNIRDFAKLPAGLTASSPDQFLCGLLATEPAGVQRALQRQAAALKKPPMSVVDILDRLDSVAPTFVARARRAIVGS